MEDRMLIPIGSIILLCIPSMMQDAGSKAADEEAHFRKYLAEEIRLGMLPELRRFNQSGSRDWGHMTEKKIIIPAVEKKIFGKRVVFTPRIEKTVKYKDGDWHRYKAEANDPDLNLKVEVLDFKEPARDQATFTVKLQAKLNVRGDVAFYRLDVGAEIPVEATTDLELIADCRADLTRGGEATDIVLKIQPRDLSAQNVRMTRLGRLGGDEARKAGDLLRELFADDLKKKQDELLNHAKDEIQKAVLHARVKSILIDVLLDH